MPETPFPSQCEQRLERIIADYLHAVEAGSAPDRAELLKQHPDLAADLGSFLRNRDAMDRIAEPLKQQVPGLETIGASPAPSGGVGTTVRYFGDYELLEEIARGGMGVVYKARQVSLNRVVALKMILAGQLASPADVGRFRAEAEAAGNLDHPNIVPIYEVGEHEGQHYFSMKLVEGGSLAALVGGRDHGPGISKDQQRSDASLVAKVARAVHHAHQRGILHRDLKPGNILIDAQDQPHVTDFGLARRVEGDSRLTQSGAIVGTPSYMAPEQARSEKVLTTGVDVYSLGAILYELLAGCPPFRAATPLDTVLQVLEEEPVAPRSIRPRIDRDLETICLKCLDKDPDRRYASAAALADELERWQAGEPIQARRTGVWERTRKWIRRRPAAAALVAVSSLAVLTLVLVGLVYNRELQEALDDARKARAEAEERETTVRRQELTVRRHLYGYDMRAVQDAWDKGNAARVRNLLNDHRPRAGQEDLRSFEWYHYWALCHEDAFTVRTPPCQAVAYSPDGRTLATAGRDGGGLRVRLWDAATGNPLKYDSTTIPNTYSIAGAGLAFSPDGKTLAAGAGKSVVLWNLATLKERATIKTKHWVQAFFFARDDANRMIVAERDGKHGEVNAWDLARHASQSLFKNTDGFSDTAVFSANGKTVAFRSSSSVGGNIISATITVSDTSTGQSRIKREIEAFNCFALSPDGKTLAVFRNGLTDVILLLETATGREQAALVVNVHKVVSGVASYTRWPATNITFSPDGRTLAATVNTTIRVWDLVARKEKATYKSCAREITALVFSPDNRRLAVVQ
jgi:eukaryotic-like serine/threonine-protein kinase